MSERGFSGAAVAGAITVSTDYVAQFEADLRAAAAACRDAVFLVQLAHDQQSAAEQSGGHRRASLAEAENEITTAARQLASLAAALSITGDLYSAVERTGAAVVEMLASQLAAVVGFIAVRVGLIALPAMIVAAGQAAALLWLLPESGRTVIIDAATAALQAALPALSEPVVVAVTRALLTVSDDAVLGALGVPPAIVAAVGESGLGLSDVGSAATAALGLAALAGGSGVDPVRVDRVESDLRRGGRGEAVAPPRTIADRVGRIPEPTAPIRIERYTAPDGSVHVEVYLAGTDTGATLGGDRPWDMASNLALIADRPSSSEQAVRAALRAEGVTDQTPIVFTGYSQGGAIATRLAESGDFRTVGLVTVGAPSGAMPIAGNYPAIVIEHREDLVPVLSGVRRDTNAVVVRADGITGEVEAGQALPAHDLDRYITTALRADAHDDSSLQSAIDALPTIPVTTGDAVIYTATRVPPTAR